jgi:hypothetical protein
MKGARPAVNVIRLSQDYVYSNDHLFNTNNLWADQRRERPLDYVEVLGEYHFAVKNS